MNNTRTDGRRMSLKAFLSFESASPVRYEYVAGEAYAMSGASTRHNIITLNVVRHLHGAARARGCRVFATDVKLRTADDRFYYPDAIVACGAGASVSDIVDTPTLIFEVTSPTTRMIDRREKLDAYLRMPSLRAYLIVDQRRRHVLVYARDAQGAWTNEQVDGDGTVVIAALNAQLTLDQVYEDIVLAPLTVRETEEWNEFWSDAAPPSA